jgi:hypothetical protein
LTTAHINRGLIKHKKESHPGEHPAIIDRASWDKVQALLDANIRGNRRKVRTTKEKRRIRLSPESAFPFLCDLTSCKFAVKFKRITDFHLLSY